MASIFDELSSASAHVSIYPTFDLADATFTLLGVELCREWVADPVSGRRTQTGLVITDESGERAQTALSFRITDASGTASSADAPVIERSHFFDMDTFKALVDRCGTQVTLTRPRVELHQPAAKQTGKDGKVYARIETKFIFNFDTVEL